jgi:hypothetical protein
MSISELSNIIINNSEYNKSIPENTYIIPDENIVYKVDKKLVYKMKRFRKEFNKLSDEQKQKVLEHDKKNYKVYRVEYNNSAHIGFTASSIHYAMLFNIYTMLDGKASFFNDINPEMIGTKITLLEIVNPKGNTRKLAITRKNHYIKKIKGNIPVAQTTLKYNYDFYLGIYKDLLNIKQKQKSIYIYKAILGIKTYLFYTPYKANLKDEAIAKKLIEHIKLHKPIKKYIQIHKLTKIMFEKIAEEKIDNTLNLDIILDKYRDIYASNFNTKRKLPETKTLKKKLTFNNKKELKNIMFVRLNKLKFNLRLSKNDKKLKNRTYIYLFKNKLTDDSIITATTTLPSSIIDTHYNKIISGKPTSNIQKDLMIYNESNFQFTILKILSNKDDKKEMLKNYKQKYNPSGYSTKLIFKKR